MLKIGNERKTDRTLKNEENGWFDGWQIQN
jgi:hypothetical protein